MDQDFSFSPVIGLRNTSSNAHWWTDRWGTSWRLGRRITAKACCYTHPDTIYRRNKPSLTLIEGGLISNNLFVGVAAVKICQEVTEFVLSVTVGKATEREKRLDSKLQADTALLCVEKYHTLLDQFSPVNRNHVMYVVTDVKDFI